eukprot:6421015-Alexandrium_andersonii.AAC.1
MGPRSSSLERLEQCCIFQVGRGSSWQKKFVAGRSRARRAVHRCWFEAIDSNCCAIDQPSKHPLAP